MNERMVSQIAYRPAAESVGAASSSRGSQRLLEAVRARAVLSGRDYVTPDDVKQIAQPTPAHRLVLTPDAMVDDIDTRAVIADVLDEVPVLTVE